MAQAAVLAGIRLAVVDVQFTVLALESFRTLAGIGTDQIFASGAVLTGRGFALVDLDLAVGARVAFLAVTSVRVADGLASTVVAKELPRYSFSDGCILTTDHFHITDLSCPSRATGTLVLILYLLTGSLILARIR